MIVHPASDFDGMRAAGKLAAQTLDMIAPHVVAGATTDELNQLCHDFIISHDAIPAPLNYHGFPKSICTSLNHVICHGIPSERRLVNGDIINIDVTVILDGWYGDTSRMYAVGRPSIKAKRLMEITYDALMIGIETIRPGTTLGDLGYAIQSFVEGRRYNVVRELGGHGIGRGFHEEPTIFHHGKKGQGLVLEAGMFLTIEPMVNIGSPDVRLLEDRWTVVTKDRSLSAQYEHTIAVTDSGFEIFTLL